MKNTRRRLQTVLFILLLMQGLAMKTDSVERHRQTDDLKTIEYLFEDAELINLDCEADLFGETKVFSTNTNQNSAERKEIFIGILPSQLNMSNLP